VLIGNKVVTLVAERAEGVAVNGQWMFLLLKMILGMTLNVAPAVDFAAVKAEPWTRN